MTEAKEGTRGGYLAAIADRKGITVDEARAEMVQEQKRKVLDLAKEIDPEEKEGGADA